jgi:hypothetical protein
MSSVNTSAEADSEADSVAAASEEAGASELAAADDSAGVVLLQASRPTAKTAIRAIIKIFFIVYPPPII